MSDRLAKAWQLIDAANAEDPNKEEHEGKEVPKELLYGERMSEMLERFAPESDDVMKAAIRGQHIQRWKTPRSDYPMDRTGYLQWRTGLYKFHAQTTADLMQQAGYSEEELERVKKAIGKKALKINKDTQLVEDIAGLVFIEYYMLHFAGQKPDYTEEKWIDIIQKTWKKMSDSAHDFALSGKITLPEPLVPLIQKALAG